MKSKISLLTLLFILVFNATVEPGITKKDNGRDQYIKAKKKCHEQKWMQAVNLFQQLIDDFPNSRYQDDAQFWIGYCLEKDGTLLLDAFLAFDRLVKNDPSSSWTDDAIVHQIAIAEKFVRNGEERYIDYLTKKLNSDASVISQYAAIALGRLGDKRALPVLHQLKRDPDFRETTQALIEQIETDKTNVSLIPEENSTDLDFSRTVDLDRPNKKGRDFLFFKSKRYKQYRSMLKKEDNWSEAELLDFGLWHVLSTKQFSEYHVLQDYDRKEWFRKFWKQQDPTPTTKTNEKLEEFKRRVNYAKAFFSDLSPFKRLKFLRDQHLMPGWEHAPWDARGELYIKYGEPDFRTFAGLREEEWNYFGLGADFRVKKYITNMYGNAISSGPISNFVHKDEPYYLDSYFIYQPEFRYQFAFKASKIKKAELKVHQKSSNNTGGNIALQYKIPAKEFKSKKHGNNYQITFLQRYVVFDEDMREVQREEAVQKLSDQSARGLKKKFAENIIDFTLEQGEYMVALRIEDLESDKIGIYLEKILVEN